MTFMLFQGIKPDLAWKWEHMEALSCLCCEAAAEQLKAAGVKAANLLEEPVDMLPPVNYSNQFEVFEGT